MRVKALTGIKNGRFPLVTDDGAVYKAGSEYNEARLLTRRDFHALLRRDLEIWWPQQDLDT